MVDGVGWGVCVTVQEGNKGYHWLKCLDNTDLEDQ